MSTSLSVSLQQARTLFELLDQIEGKVDQINRDSVSTRMRLSELHQLATQVLRMVQRMSGDEDLSRAVGQVMQLTSALYALSVAILTLQASTPIGWAVAGLQLVGAGMVFASSLSNTMDAYQSW